MSAKHSRSQEQRNEGGREARGSRQRNWTRFSASDTRASVSLRQSVNLSSTALLFLPILASLRLPFARSSSTALPEERERERELRACDIETGSETRNLAVRREREIVWWHPASLPQTSDALITTASGAVTGTWTQEQRPIVAMLSSRAIKATDTCA